MGLSNPTVKYGVHSVAAMNKETGEIYGIAKVIGSASLNLAGELTDLNGGSSPYPWASQPGLIKPELSLKLKEYPPWLTELFAGKKPTVTDVASTTGEVTDLVNQKGTLVKADVGIASIGLKADKEADVKFLKILIKAISATTVHAYVTSDIDFARGTGLEFQDDQGRITVDPLTVPDEGGTVEIPGTGLELTGGSGVIAMTVGDTATCESYPMYKKKVEVSVGAPTDTFPEFELTIVGEKVGANQINELTVYRCKGIGLPLGFDEKTFSEPEIKCKVFLDASKNAVYKERLVVAQG